MSVFENFPYTNFHNLNLDWVLNKLKSFEERLNKIETNGGGAGGGTGGGTGGGSSIDVTALEAKIAAKQDKLTFDTEPTRNSDNPVTSGGVYTAIDSTTTTLNNSLDHINNDLESKIADKQDKLTFDTAPTQNSNNPVTSGGVYTAIDNIKGGSTFDPSELEAKIAAKQDKLTFDTTPTQNSTNPVTSGGVSAFVNKSIFDNNNNNRMRSDYEYFDGSDGSGSGYNLTVNTYALITSSTLVSFLPGKPTRQTVPMISFTIETHSGATARTAVVGFSNCYNLMNEHGEYKLCADCYSYDGGDMVDLKFNILLNEHGISLRVLGDGAGTVHVDRLSIEIMFNPIWDYN